jgi:sensitive to high expression protein 9
MDEVLPKLALVTQKVNTYTGTDYSGVEALRREIKEQGTSVVLYEFALANSVQRIS